MNYFRPKTLDEALQLLAENAGTIKPIAGGTDLMVKLREGKRRIEGVDAFLDVRCIPELHEITENEQYLVIGAGVTHTQITESPLVNRYCEALAKASATVGSQQIRNAGTIGGNICNGSLAADTLSPLTAMAAILELRSAKEKRLVEISRLYLGRGKLDIRPDELLVRILLPLASDYAFSFIKLGRRKALAISRMNVAVAMKKENGVISDLRIAPGCVFSNPERAFAAEQLLLGKTPGRELFSEAGKAVSAQMIERTGVRWSTEYKQPVIEALTERALQEASEKLI